MTITKLRVLRKRTPTQHLHLSLVKVCESTGNRKLTVYEASSQTVSPSLTPEAQLINGSEGNETKYIISSPLSENN